MREGEKRKREKEREGGRKRDSQTDTETWTELDTDRQKVSTCLFHSLPTVLNGARWRGFYPRQRDVRA